MREERDKRTASQDPDLLEEIGHELQEEAEGMTLSDFIQSHEAEASASQGVVLFVIDHSAAQATEQETLTRICNEARRRLGWSDFDADDPPTHRHLNRHGILYEGGDPEARRHGRPNRVKESRDMGP